MSECNNCNNPFCPNEGLQAENEALRKEVQTMAQLLKEGVEIMEELKARRCEGCVHREYCFQNIEQQNGNSRFELPVDSCSLWEGKK